MLISLCQVKTKHMGMTSFWRQIQIYFSMTIVALGMTFCSSISHALAAARSITLALKYKTKSSDGFDFDAGKMDQPQDPIGVAWSPNRSPFGNRYIEPETQVITLNTTILCFWRCFSVTQSHPHFFKSSTWPGQQNKVVKLFKYHFKNTYNWGSREHHWPWSNPGWSDSNKKSLSLIINESNLNPFFSLFGILVVGIIQLGTLILFAISAGVNGLASDTVGLFAQVAFEGVGLVVEEAPSGAVRSLAVKRVLWRSLGSLERLFLMLFVHFLCQELKNWACQSISLFKHN